MPNETNQQIQEAKQEIKSALQVTGQKPDVFINLGNVAEQALQDKSLYNNFRQQALSIGLGTPADIPEQPNPFILTLYVTVGKLTAQMIQSGELGG
jgi:hypothetical protein